MTGGAIDYRASFWSLPEAEWSRWYVRIRFGNFPPRQQWLDGDGADDVWRVDKLVDAAPDAHFAFRSLMLFASHELAAKYAERNDPEDGVLVDCYGDDHARWGLVDVNPILIDIDRQSSRDPALNVLRDRILRFIDERRWSYRLYDSGTGYHIEVDPLTVSAKDATPDLTTTCRAHPSCSRLYDGDWRCQDLSGFLLFVRCAIGDTHSYSNRPIIDAPGNPYKLCRMVGSMNSKSGQRKHLLDFVEAG